MHKKHYKCLVACHIGSLIFIMGLGIATASESTATPEQTTCTDQILLVSTRGMPCRVGRTMNLDSYRGRELSADGSSTSRRLPLLTAAPFANTWVFVHGNQIPPSEATRQGMMVYRRLRRGSDIHGPVRFVIWSWPSERATGRIRDARQKARRTDVEAFLLGSYLAKASTSESISLVGFSFGARIITGAVHLVGGGSLAGYHLSEVPDTVIPFRVSLLAAAVENNGLLPGGRYHRALRHIDRLLLMNNSHDRALNFFWIIDPKRRPKALGDTGIARAPGALQIEQYDWAHCIGREHSLMEYLCRSAIMNRVSLHLSR